VILNEYALYREVSNNENGDMIHPCGLMSISLDPSIYKKSPNITKPDVVLG
jgi:hypothetical protein